jgi:hypothetical protein
VFLPSLNGYLAPLLGYKADTGVLSLEVDGRFAPESLQLSNVMTLHNVSLSQTGLDIIQRNTGVPLPIALALLTAAAPSSWPCRCGATHLPAASRLDR